MVTFIHDFVVFPVSSETSDLVRDFAWQVKRSFLSILVRMSAGM